MQKKYTETTLSLTILLRSGIDALSKVGKTMKESFNKIILIGAAILISCIVVYGIVYAQQVCCSTIVESSILTSNRISVSYNIDNTCRISPSHYLNNQLRSNLCSNNIPADSGEGNACCETDSCDSYHQATYLSISFFQDFCPLHKNVSFFDAGDGAQSTFEPYSLSTSLKVVPIYILTQSIIC